MSEPSLDFPDRKPLPVRSMPMVWLAAHLPIFAPKERDLMFVGGGLVGTGHTSQEEETLFYQGYGQTKVDPITIAYYRSERIIEDIAVYCEQIFLSDKGGEDRKQYLINVKSNYLPNGRIEIASQ